MANNKKIDERRQELQDNPILEIMSQPGRTMVQTVTRGLQTADRLGGLVQSKIGPVRTVRDF